MVSCLPRWTSDTQYYYIIQIMLYKLSPSLAPWRCSSSCSSTLRRIQHGSPCVSLLRRSLPLNDHHSSCVAVRFHRVNPSFLKSSSSSGWIHLTKPCMAIYGRRFWSIPATWSKYLSRFTISCL